MSYPRDGFRGPARPDDRANAWRIKRIAYLDQVFTEAVAYEIEAEATTEQGLVICGLQLVRLLPREATPRDDLPAGTRFSVDWLVADRWGDHAVSEDYGVDVVNVWGTPNPDTLLEPREIKPYTDILYYRGPMRLTVPDKPGFEIGLESVVSLELITASDALEVWS